MTTNDTPFNNPGASPALVEMWRSNLRKSQRQPLPVAATPSVLTFNFDGGGQVLQVGQGGVLEVTFPCRILGCHIYAGVMTVLGPVPIVATASVVLGLAAQGSWALGSRPLYATIVPALTALAEASVDISGWVTELQPGDLISYGLIAFSGAATFLTLTLPVRRLDVSAIGISGVAATGDTVVDGSGNEVILRS